MKLRRNEFCPIHRSLYCCGREGETSKRERREKKYIAPPLTTTYCRFSIHPRVLSSRWGPSPAATHPHRD